MIVEYLEETEQYKAEHGEVTAYGNTYEEAVSTCYAEHYKPKGAHTLGRKVLIDHKVLVFA